jgi:hypothetical protein
MYQMRNKEERENGVAMLRYFLWTGRYGVPGDAVF